MLALYFCLFLSCLSFECYGSNKKPKIEFSQKTVSEQLKAYFKFRDNHQDPVIIERVGGRDYSDVENCLEVNGKIFDCKQILMHGDELLNAKNIDGFVAYITPIIVQKDALDQARRDKWEAAKREHSKDIEKA